MEIVTVGIDVSKAKLDIYYSGEYKVIANTASAISTFIESMRGLTYRVVLEATGKYHFMCHELFSCSGISVMVTNPKRSRDYARALGYTCKTDSIDARILSEFGCHHFTATRLDSKEERTLKFLLRLLSDHMNSLHRYQSQMRDACSSTKASYERIVLLIKQEILCVESRISTLVSCHEEMREKSKLLCTIPGIGEKSSYILLGNLCELGEVNKGKISALCGLVPHNRDSGTYRGKRNIIID